ncbi:MAG: hypothetical protein N3B13_01965 [Deltaproteobacteria bacterium]|nr:hypothetical protein [Deltaproteobacteria bacterium]
MNLLKIIINLVLLLSVLSSGCQPDTQTYLKTEIRFLYDDCLNSPVKHTSTIPSNITNIRVSLIREGKTFIEKEIQNNDAQTYAIINDIEPYNKYKLVVKAFTKDNVVWSGFAENVEIRPNSKTFVQINLTREKALTCADYSNNKRFMHTSVRLSGGRILLFGGAHSAAKDYDIYHLESSENAEVFYQYKIEHSDNINTGIIAGSFRTLNSKMSSGRIGYIYEILPDGKILIAGGINRGDITKNPDDFFLCLNEKSEFINDIELFDPEKEDFSVIARLNTPFAFAGSARIGNRIYIISGIKPGFDCKNPSPAGLNNTFITIDLTDIKSPKINEEQITDDFSFFAGGRIQISEKIFLFYGGNREDGLILNEDGTIKKVTFDISPDFSTKTPQRQYFPQAYALINGNLYINIAGYYKAISERYYIKINPDGKIKIEPDKMPEEPVFASSDILIGDYLFQTGGIRSLPFTVSDSFIVRKLETSDYRIIDGKTSGTEKLKRERVFHSTTEIGNNMFLITGGIYFNQAQDAIALDLAEIYNGNGLINQ